MKNIKFDFENDYIQYVKSQIANWGFDVNGLSCNINQILYTYHNLKRRLIPVRNREILEAQGFLCPAEVRAGYLKFCEDCLDGQNLNKYLSKSTKKLDKEDLMLNDWGIHHFHLGEEMESQNSHFVKRTKELLFAIVKHSKIYCIGIFEHGDWTKQSIISIIESNWRFLIESYKLKGENIKLAQQFSDSDLKELRDNHINTPIQTDSGNVYFGAGGGINGSGGSAQAVDSVINDIDMLEYIRKRFEDLLPFYFDNLDRHATFHLQITSLQICAYSEHLGITIPLWEKP